MAEQEQAAIEQAAETVAAATGQEPSRLAQIIASALVDPVVRVLLVDLIAQAVRQEIAAERARNLSGRQGTPPPTRGSTKTAWVGDALRRQQAEQQGSQQ